MTDIVKQIFLWHGENDLDIFEKTRFWLDAFRKKHTGLNVFSFDLDSGARDRMNVDIKNALLVNSLFGMNKLIILKNFLSAKSKLNAELTELIVDSLDKIPAGFFVVFCQGAKPDARGKIYLEIKKMEKAGRAEIAEFRLPKRADLTKWIFRRAEKYQAELAPDAAAALAAAVPDDLWRLDREIHKLANYKRGVPISVDDVNLMVRGKYNEDIFQLMDAISAKDKKRTLKLFQDQLDSGANEIYLLTMLTRQFRIFWQIKEFSGDKNFSPNQIAQELGLHPYVVQKGLYYLKNYSFPQIKKIYRQLLDFEIKIKTSTVKFEVLFDLLVAEL